MEVKVMQLMKCNVMEGEQFCILSVLAYRNIVLSERPQAIDRMKCNVKYQ